MALRLLTCVALTSALLGASARAGLPPELAPAHEPTPAAEDGPWSIELGINAEPEQPYEATCRRGDDCLTGAKAYFGGALRGAYRVTDAWSLIATVGLTTLLDQEERPPSYAVLSLRTDIQVEIGRRADRFGAALRLSPVLLVAWADTGADVSSDFPGVALVLGTTRLWGELGVRTLPTPSDPRGFHLAFGFKLARWSGTAGLGTFATLGFVGSDVDAVGASPGVYGDVAMRVTERFDLRVLAVISSPVLLGLGFGWRFAR